MASSSGSILVFDAETTGTDKRRDQIIELCVQAGLEPSSPSRVWRFLPEVPISPGAQEVHGITLEELAGCPRFADEADELRTVFERAEVLVGYNLRFDIDMLQQELARAKRPPLDLSRVKIVDAYRLWQQCEPRSLQDAHRRFVGEEFGEAHSARADVAATGRVLRGMVEQFRLEEDFAKLASLCEPDRPTWLGSTGHIRWGEDGRAVLGFGKHRGRSLAELASGSDAGYLRWMLLQDFPDHVRSLCERALELEPARFEAWVKETYGGAARPSCNRSMLERASAG